MKQNYTAYFFTICEVGLKQKWKHIIVPIKNNEENVNIHL